MKKAPLDPAKTFGLFPASPISKLQTIRLFAERKVRPWTGFFVKFNGKWGCIDEKGQFVIEPRFDNMHFVDQTVALVCVGDLWGYVMNEEGQLAVIEPQFDDAMGFDRTGIACVRVGDLYGFIDKNGHYIIEPQFKDYSPY